MLKENIRYFSWRQYYLRRLLEVVFGAAWSSVEQVVQNVENKIKHNVEIMSILLSFQIYMINILVEINTLLINQVPSARTEAKTSRSHDTIRCDFSSYLRLSLVLYVYRLYVACEISIILNFQFQLLIIKQTNKHALVNKMQG